MLAKQKKEGVNKKLICLTLDPDVPVHDNELIFRDGVESFRHQVDQELTEKWALNYENIDDLAGLSKNHPLISLSLLIILFSLAGIPPMAGFFAKFYVFMAVIETKMYMLAIIGLVTTVVSAFYYLRIIKIIYFDKPKKPFDESYDWGLKSVLILSSGLILIYFIYPSVLTNIISSITIY